MQDTTMGGSDRQFPETCWQSVLEAREGKDRTHHLQQLVQRYWKPIYAFIRVSWKKSNEEAKDLAQDFFAQVLLDEAYFEGVDPVRGQFRHYIKACLRHFLLDQHKREKRIKRGGQLEILQIDEQKLPLVASGTDPEAVFRQEWIRTLIQDGVEELSRTASSAGRDRAYQLFRMIDVDALPDQRPSYQQLAEQFGVSHQTVKTDVDYARRAFKRVLYLNIRSYCENEQIAGSEYTDLFPL